MHITWVLTWCNGSVRSAFLSGMHELTIREQRRGTVPRSSTTGAPPARNLRSLAYRIGLTPIG
jgi:hypothetical protein